MLFENYTDPDQRFALRELERMDASNLKLLNDALFFSYLRHLTGPKRFLDEAIAAQSSEPRMQYDIGIVLPRDRTRLIGVVGAIITDSSAAIGAYSLEVGFAVVPAFQKRGIARSALCAFLARALTPQVAQLTATVDPENLPSIRLLETCGFERSGPAKTSKYLGDPDNPTHYEAGVLQLRPRMEYRVNADGFR